MSVRSRAPYGAFKAGRPYLAGVALIAVIAVTALWLYTLLRAPADSGTLDQRVTAVGATVRCPICPQPIPLNDVQNPQALQMRQFIHSRLQLGFSEEQVRQQLVERYGAGILLAPPQRGFDLLIWLVPLGAVAACGAAVLLAVRRWSGGQAGLPASSAPPTAPPGPELQRYEELLDRELAARE